MQIFPERNLTFHFPDDARVARFDRWPFVEQYKRENQGTKDVDLIALRPDDENCWLIEATDYRIFANQRAIDKAAKPSALIDEFDKKIRDSLTLLQAATVDAPPAEQSFAQAALARVKKRAVLHLEPHIEKPGLYPAVEHLADIKAKLKQKLSDIDRNIIVMSMDRPSEHVFWSVTQNEIQESS